jgi:glycosyltransferase involved in cell wall biosynthesis
MTPRFSVVIPAFNSAATLARAVESVLAQTWPAHEILILDDASTDATPAIAKSFGERVRHLRRDVNAGVSAARNRGAEEATGDWLAFLDADDWYFPSRLEMHAAWIREDSSLDFLTGDYEYRDASGTLLGTSMAQHASGRAMLEKAHGAERVMMEASEFEAYVGDHFGDTHTLSVPRNTFLEVGGYPVGFKVCEDVHLLTRIVARARRAGVICRPMGVYLIHGNSACRRDPLAAQQENVRTLTHLKQISRSFPAPVQRGVEARMRAARVNLGYALARVGHRGAAMRAVMPSLLEQPGWGTVRSVLSMLRG